ncbi:MAG: hypothetical protein ACREJC_02010 [Tepidisphaeraceae bacterium]
MGKEYPTTTLGPWANGMNNRLAEFELKGEKLEFLREAFNVDVSDTGRVRSRRGFTRIRTNISGHSVFAAKGRFLFCDSGDLRLGVPPGDSVILSGLPTQMPMAYVEVNDEIRLSNGFITKRLTAGGALTPWGVATPSGAPTASPLAFGALDEGRYQVAVTHVAPDGEESGASIVAIVDVAAGGGIQLVGIPQPSDGYATLIRIYVTKQNGDLFYLYDDVPVGTFNLDVFASSALGPALDTFFLQPFPPCSSLEYYNGRIYGANGPFVFYTESFRYGLFRPAQNFIMFPSDVTVLKAVEDGFYVCADQTYWLGGPTPKTTGMRTLFPFGGVRGTGVKREDNREVGWFSPKGFVVAGNGGSAKLATDAQLVVPVYDSGAMLYREDRGLRQFAGTFRGATQSSFVASDYAEAEIVRSAS